MGEYLVYSGVRHLHDIYPFFYYYVTNHHASRFPSRISWFMFLFGVPFISEHGKNKATTHRLPSFFVGYMWTCGWVTIFFWNNQKKLTFAQKASAPSLDAMALGGSFGSLLVGWGYLDLEDGKAWVKPITDWWVCWRWKKNDFKPCWDWWERFTLCEETIWRWWR